MREGEIATSFFSFVTVHAFHAPHLCEEESDALISLGSLRVLNP
jgi:hypothetical protein